MKRDILNEISKGLKRIHLSPFVLSSIHVRPLPFAPFSLVARFLVRRRDSLSLPVIRRVRDVNKRSRLLRTPTRRRRVSESPARDTRRNALHRDLERKR